MSEQREVTSKHAPVLQAGCPAAQVPQSASALNPKPPLAPGALGQHSAVLWHQTQRQPGPSGGCPGCGKKGVDTTHVTGGIGTAEGRT